MGEFSFHNRLDRIVMEVATSTSQSWISPDSLWDENWKETTAFVYDLDGRLYHIESGTHGDLFEIEGSLNDFEHREEATAGGMLLGRIGFDVNRRTIISFWNEHPSDYAGTRLSECLQALEDDGLLDRFEEPIIVSTPVGSFNYTGPKDTRDIAKTSTDLSPEKKREHQELLKKVHTLHGSEKKAAMEKLGLGFKTPGKHPWQKAQERAGMLGPGQKWWAPQSESFEGRLDRILAETAVLEPKSQTSWISPDDLWMVDGDFATAFVFDATDNTLYQRRGGTHSDIFNTESDFFFEVRQEAMDQGLLLGRVGYDSYGRLVASFWNSNPSHYANGKLANCMQELEREVLPANEEVIVSTPIGSYNYAEYTKETENLAKSTELSPEKQKEYQELLKKVHTLRGDEKKAAMKKLGLGWKTPGKHPWQKSQEKVGMLGPGQKWWAPQSESRQ